MRIRGKKIAGALSAALILFTCLSMPVQAHEVSPNPTGKITINLLVAAIDPQLSSLDGGTFCNGSTTIRASEYFGFSLDNSLSMWVSNFEEVSHQTVKFNIVDTVIIDEFPKYTSRASLDNASFQRIFPKNGGGYGDWYAGITNPEFAPYDTVGDLDYNHYIDLLNLVKRKNAGEFDMVFLIGVDPLSPWEACMVGRSPFFVNGGTYVKNCDNFVIVTPTFSRQDGSIENIGHMAENMLGYNYCSIYYEKGCINGTNYAALNDWQKYCLCEYLASPGTEVYGYGMVHFSPNSERDYDWSNSKTVKYYKDWKNGTGIESFSASCYLDNPAYSYNGDPCISHHRWWFSNMPHEDGRDENGYFKNWWRYIFTPDYVVAVLNSEDYNNYVIGLEKGDEVPVNVDLLYFSDKRITVDAASIQAPVSVADTSVAVWENGKLRAVNDGETTLIVAVDGEKLEYWVSVGKKEEPVPEESVSAQPEEKPAVSSNEPEIKETEEEKEDSGSVLLPETETAETGEVKTGRNIVIRIICVAVGALAVAAGVVFVICKKKKNKE